MYQITTKYTKWPSNILNVRKIYQMSIKCNSIFHCQTLKKIPYWYFWFKNVPSGKPGVKSLAKAACPVQTNPIQTELPSNGAVSSTRRTRNCQMCLPKMYQIAKGAYQKYTKFSIVGIIRESLVSENVAIFYGILVFSWHFGIFIAFWYFHGNLRYFDGI
jgi:F0F1-type ATP synthase gamma subunit